MRTRCRAGSQGNPGFPGLPIPPLPCPGWGSPVCAPVFASVIARTAGRRLGQSAALRSCGRATAGNSRSLTLFSSETSKTKRLSNLFGERSDAQRTSPLLLSLLLSEPPCGLGRIRPRAHPHQRQPAWGAGPRSAGVPRGVRGTVRIGCGNQGSRGRVVSGSGATVGL